MNNEGFKKLVLDRGQSTKKIARAAVEAEFKKKGKGNKRKYDDYSSDSDDNDQKPKKRDLPLFRPSQVKEKGEENEESSQTYRDRAKERREGVKEDSALTAYDHHVSLPITSKGLNLTLVRKERAQLRRNKDDGLEDERNIQEPLLLGALPTTDQALRALETCLAEPSSLSSEISDYLKQFLNFAMKDLSKKVVCGIQGKILQRTRLVMHSLGHPSDRRRTWERPREIIHSKGQDYPVIPFVSRDILDAIELNFPTKWKNLESGAPTIIQQPTKSSSQNETMMTPYRKVDDDGDDDDDDDIYCGLDDYVPPKATAS